MKEDKKEETVENTQDQNQDPARLPQPQTESIKSKKHEVKYVSSILNA